MSELVKVMIEKFDDRSGERIMRTQILRRFVIKSVPTRPSNPLGQFLKKKKKKMENFDRISNWTLAVL